MATTIQISADLQKELKNRKFFDNESYEDIIWDLLEDTLELNEQTKREIAQGRSEYKKGRTKSLAHIKTELGL